MFVMSGLMVVWFQMRLLVFPHLVRGSLLNNLDIVGALVGGVMFIMVAPMQVRGSRFLFGSWAFANRQRAELWGVILALECTFAVYSGVDNFECGTATTPIELVNDGDLLLIVDKMLQLRGLDMVRITKVKGHADEGMVLDGRVREQDRFGNNAADEAADFGRRRVDHTVIDARRHLSGVCGRWYLIFFFVCTQVLYYHSQGCG